MRNARFVVPGTTLALSGRGAPARRSARVLLTTALAGGLVVAGLCPAQAAMATSSVTTSTVAAAAATASAVDAFGRTVASGWGTADKGGAWTSAVNASVRQSVAPGAGRHAVLKAGHTGWTYLDGAATTDADLRFDVGLDKVANGGGTYLTAVGRNLGTAGDYRTRLKVSATGAVNLNIGRGNTVLKAVNVAGLTITAGSKVSVRLQVTGTSPTTIRAKVWRAGAAEPSAWQVSTTDSTTALQKAGGLAVATYISGSATNVPVTAAWSNVTAVPTAATVTSQVQPNVAPTASAKVSVSDLTAVFDGSASVDPDGSIAQHLWDFGDGTTGTGATPRHVYAAPGTYTATLTVKDNAGATGMTTSTVQAVAPNVAPVARLAVSAQDLKVTADAGASSDADGRIASYAWSFGDGATATGAVADHVFASAGTYTVTLRVTDDRGATSTATSTVAVKAPVRTGPAGPDTTGVPAGKVLKVHYGDLYITTPGAVIDGLDIRGLVRVKADGVVIRNSIVRGKPLTGAMGLINNDAGAYSFTLEDSELIPTEASSYVNGIIGHNFTVRRTEIARVIDSVHITGSNVTIEDSWLHDNLFYANDPGWNGGPSHADSIQIQAGSNHRFLRNRIEGAYSSAFQTTQDRGPISDVVIEGNYINGGGCSVNIAWGSRYAPIPGSALQIRNNTFGTDTRHSRCAVIAPSPTGATLVNNAFVDGKDVTISRGW